MKTCSNRFKIFKFSFKNSFSKFLMCTLSDNTRLKLFIYSGSEVSIVKNFSLVKPNSMVKSKLVGIDKSPVLTLGSTDINFFIKNFSLSQNF